MRLRRKESAFAGGSPAWFSWHLGRAGMTETVFIIEDDASLRESTALVLESVGIKALAFSDVSDFLRIEREGLEGCLLLDVRLPGTNGLDFQKQVMDLGLALPIVMMTGHGDIAMTVRAMKAGAVDFLTKPFGEKELVDAVTAALQLGRTQRQKRVVYDEAISLFESLTPRELQIMGLVAAGMLNKQIAFELGISLVTVKIHRAAAMKKLKARNIADFIRISDRARPGAAEAAFTPTSAPSE